MKSNRGKKAAATLLIIFFLPYAGFEQFTNDKPPTSGTDLPLLARVS